MAVSPEFYKQYIANRRRLAKLRTTEPMTPENEEEYRRLRTLVHFQMIEANSHQGAIAPKCDDPVGAATEAVLNVLRTRFNRQTLAAVFGPNGERIGGYGERYGVAIGDESREIVLFIQGLGPATEACIRTATRLVDETGNLVVK